MKLNDIWGYGQLFGFSAYEGFNRYDNDLILMTMKDNLSFRCEFKDEWIKINFSNNKDEVIYKNVMSDFVVAEVNKNSFVLTFADCDTLVGTCCRLPKFVGEFDLKITSISDSHKIIKSKNHFLEFIYVKENGLFRFLIHHSINQKLSKKEIEKYLAKDIKQLIEHYKNYYFSMPRCNDLKYEKLFYKSISVNKVNTHSPEGNIKYFWTTPDRVPHRHMWLWDSGFHALMMSRFNIKAAEDSIIAMLTQIQKDGFLPHMANPHDCSDVTQPCILSWISYELYLKSHNKKFLKNVVSYLDKYLTYDFLYRDYNHDGLLSWKTDPNDVNCKCGESGLDNSPRFDFDEDMDCIDFSCYFALDAKYLSKIYKVLGNKRKEKYWKEKYIKTTKLINDLMYDESTHAFYDYLYSKKLSKFLTPASFLPLSFGLVSKKRAEKMIEVLFDKNLLCTKFPFSTISQKDNRFSNDMWRGGVWINLNYFIIRGLKLYGRSDLAKLVRDKTLNFVNEWYLKTGCIFEFFDPLNKVAPFKCDRKGKQPKNPDYRIHVHSITDYHWSAAFVYLLIQNDY